MEQELSALEQDEASPEADVDEAPDHPSKVVRFSRLAKFGILVAAVLVLFLAASVVASALGFNIWRAAVKWDQNNMSMSSVGGSVATKEEDPYFQLRQAIQNEGVSESVVPSYLPNGYELTDFCFFDSFEEHTYKASFQGEEQMLRLSLYIRPTDVNDFYPKDDLESEIYKVNGIEHYITTNEGYYRAVWSNGEVVCELYGLGEKAELLKIIDSIYKG